jgi:hypothetical protein
VLLTLEISAPLADFAIASAEGATAAGGEEIGVGTVGRPAAPPSEPCVRISRTRLSGRWSYPVGDGRSATRAATKLKNPWAVK